MAQIIDPITESQMEKAAFMLKAVAHPARLALLQLISQKGEISVGDLQARLGLSQSMTSQHLKALKSMGIVACRREANMCHYYILNKNVLKLLACVKNCCKPV